MARASASEFAAAEAQLNDTSPSLTVEAGGLVPDYKPSDHPTVVLAVLCVAQFVSALDVFIVNVALRKIGVGVGTSSLSDPQLGSQRLRDRDRCAADPGGPYR